MITSLLMMHEHIRITFAAGMPSSASAPVRVTTTSGVTTQTTVTATATRFTSAGGTLAATTDFPFAKMSAHTRFSFEFSAAFTNRNMVAAALGTATVIIQYRHGSSESGRYHYPYSESTIAAAFIIEDACGKSPPPPRSLR